VNLGGAPLTGRNSGLPTKFSFETHRGSYAGRELRSIPAVAATRDENCGLSPHSRIAKMGQGVTHAGLTSSARRGEAFPAWHVFCSLESMSARSKALRGVVVSGLTSIRQGLLGPTPRNCFVRAGVPVPASRTSSLLKPRVVC
jgi:hypothetical protein